MRRAILDTDILSEYLKGKDAQVAAHALHYGQTHDQFEFVSVTVHEVLFGLWAKGAIVQAEKAAAWLERNVEHTPNSTDYRTAAKVRATARLQGRILELADCLIAVVASRFDATLVTGNTAHYEAMRAVGLELDIHNWRLP